MTPMTDMRLTRHAATREKGDERRGSARSTVSRFPLPVSLIALGLAALTSCKEVEILNTNNPSIDQLTNNPTAATVATATQGLLITIRGLAGTYAQTAGIF